MSNVVIPKKPTSVKMRTSIFMSHELHADLKAVALDNLTSLNAAMVHMLSEGVNSEQTDKIIKRKDTLRENMYRACLYVEPAIYETLKTVAEVNGVSFNTLCLKILESNFDAVK
jgi:predicted HicB family RNase H-like nuclease